MDEYGVAGEAIGVIAGDAQERRMLAIAIATADTLI
jgi:hypothetical protein